MPEIHGPASATMQGIWLLVEREQHLLTAGDKTYTGVSLRRALDPVGRAILIPELKAAAQRSVEASTNVGFDSREWTVRTIPIIAPQSREVTAVLGIYELASESTPPPPLIGSWEWEVSPPGRNQTIKSHWDDGMFEIYGFEPAGEQSSAGAWPTPRWFNEIIVPEDRARLKVVIDEGISAVTPNLHTIIYSVIIGKDSSKPGRRKLRLSGRAHTDETSEIVWLRGITHEISDHIEDATPGLQSASTDDFLRAALELATDVAIAAVDTRYWHVYMTSPGWESVGLVEGNDISRSTSDDGEVLKLRDFLLEAAAAPAVSEVPLVVKLLTQSGERKFFSVRASGIRSGSEKHRYVMMRVSPA